MLHVGKGGSQGLSELPRATQLGNGELGSNLGMPAPAPTDLLPLHPGGSGREVPGLEQMRGHPETFPQLWGTQEAPCMGEAGGCPSEEARTRAPPPSQ